MGTGFLATGVGCRSTGVFVDIDASKASNCLILDCMTDEGGMLRLGRCSCVVERKEERTGKRCVTSALWWTTTTMVSSILDDTLSSPTRVLAGLYSDFKAKNGLDKVKELYHTLPFGSRIILGNIGLDI